MLDKLEQLVCSYYLCDLDKLFPSSGSSFPHLCLVDQVSSQASLALVSYYSMTNKILCLRSGPAYLRREIRPFAFAVAILR